MAMEGSDSNLYCHENRKGTEIVMLISSIFPTVGALAG